MAVCCPLARRMPARIQRTARLLSARPMTSAAAPPPPLQPPMPEKFMPVGQCNRTVSSVYPTLDIPSGNKPLHKFIFDELSAEDGKKTALVDAVTGETMTYAQVHDNVNRFGSSLARQGLQRGDVVAIFLPNTPHYATAFLGTMAAGGVVTSINSLYTAPELVYQLRDASAKVLITCTPFLDTATLAAREHGLDSVICIGQTSDGEHEMNGVRVVPFSKHLQDDGSCLPEHTYAAQTDVCVLPYSSGTTGLPKGVELTHRNLIANILQLCASTELIHFNRCENESVLCVLPFFHIYGMVVLLLNGLFQRTRLVTLPKFEPESYLSAIQSHGITQLFVAPPLAVFLAKNPAVSQFDLSSVYSVFSGAAPLGGELTEAVSLRLNDCKVMQGYGLTELSPVAHVSPFSAPRHGSVGIAVPNTEVSIVDGRDPDNAVMVGKGVAGEICVRGPQVMRGYLNRPDATAATIDTDGWLHTGDIGYHDEDGYLFVTDRLKELIKRKGFQVAPAEIERELLSHPLIDDAAVIGVPDDREGELPRAFVVRKSGSEVSEKDIMEYMSKRVAPYKQLDGGIVFAESIPKSPSGKILRRELRASMA